LIFGGFYDILYHNSLFCGFALRHKKWTNAAIPRFFGFLLVSPIMTHSYESPTTFTRAFKELHGAAPTSARKTSVSLKTYPAISFVLTIKGVNEMNFRIEKKESFQIMGLSGYISGELIDGMPSVVKEFFENYYPRINEYYTAPFQQVSVYDFDSADGKTKVIIGAEYKGEKPDGLNLDIKDVPGATWVVFTIEGCISETYDAAFARILTEWFPASNYKRDETAPHLEVLPVGSEALIWEICIPVINK